MTRARAVRLSAKGQLVIPKDMREALGVKEGDELLIAVEGSRVVLSRAAQHARRTRGLLKGTWGKSARDVARYVEEERRSWR